ncbi:MAG: hypothetical protein EOP10_08840 [Proteobacteria bacterium]|nr:MAG: hypothetical protein EOP10_08840 [Pseudomonadota bacterium]
MQAPVHPDIILDLYRRALTPIGEAEGLETDESFAGVDQIDDSPFQGALPDDLDLSPEELEAEELKAREVKAQSLLRSFKGPL